MNTIQEGWEGFLRAYGGGATPHQARVMKVTFYAGASHMLRIMWQLGKVESEDAAVAILNSLQEENDQFIRDYLAGAGLSSDKLEEFMRILRA